MKKISLLELIFKENKISYTKRVTYMKVKETFFILNT